MRYRLRVEAAPFRSVAFMRRSSTLPCAALKKTALLVLQAAAAARTGGWGHWRGVPRGGGADAGQGLGDGITVQMGRWLTRSHAEWALLD